MTLWWSYFILSIFEKGSSIAGGVKNCGNSYRLKSNQDLCDWKRNKLLTNYYANKTTQWILDIWYKPFNNSHYKKNMVNRGHGQKWQHSPMYKSWKSIQIVHVQYTRLSRAGYLMISLWIAWSLMLSSTKNYGMLNDISVVTMSITE